jgi:hypothetical protein
MSLVRRWATGTLRELGIHPSPGAMQILVGWARAEGGHTNGARFNFANTTQREAGSGVTGTQGDIAVYPSLAEGVKGTADTLRNGRYGGILAALRAGDPSAGAAAIGASPWGTGGDLVRRTIAETGPVSPATAIMPLRAADARDASRDDRAGTDRHAQPVFDQAGYQQAQRKQLLATFLQHNGRGNSILFKSGLLSTAPVDPTQFRGSETVTLPGARVPGGSGQALEDGCRVPRAHRRRPERCGRGRHAAARRDHREHRLQPRHEARPARARYGFVGQPWCGIFAGMVLKQGRRPRRRLVDREVAAIEQHARAGERPVLRLRRPAAQRPPR